MASEKEDGKRPEFLIAEKRVRQHKALCKLIDHYRSEAAKKPRSPTLKDAISLKDDLLQEILSIAKGMVYGIPMILSEEDDKNGEV